MRHRTENRLDPFHLLMKWRKATWLLMLLPSATLAEDNRGVSFESAVLPILQQKCMQCHGGNAPQGDLDLRSASALFKGGKSGAAIAPGNSAGSLIVSKINSGAMPPVGAKLTPDEVNVIRSWINQSAPPALGPAEPVLTEQQVLPILQMRCVTCHGKRRQEGDLDLRTQASRLKGGKSGPALVPGKPEESLLYRRIVSGEMPPAKLLYENNVRPPTSAEVVTVRKWIASGARPAPTGDAKAATKESVIREKDLDFWAFKPPGSPAIPTVRNVRLVRNPIDAFLLHKLEGKGLGYSPEAPKLTLVRRAYLDLIGLPPSHRELEAFFSDKRPDAYERLIDQLLASPHYGERWAQLWLDLAGYADSEGVKESDDIRPNAWRYRDYVIRAFSSNKPYDRFLVEQIAGDELLDYKKLREVTAESIDTLAATGFLRMASDPTDSPSNASIEEKMTVIADEIEVLSSSVMGLTMGCARCHDHKYDPVPQRDYYRLSAVLQTAYDPYEWLSASKRVLDIGLESERKEVEAFNAPLNSQIKQLEAAIETKAKPWRKQALEEGLSSLSPAVQTSLRALATTPEGNRSAAQQELAEKYKEILSASNDQLVKKFPEFKIEANKLKKPIDDLRRQLLPKPQIRALYDMGGDPAPVYVLRRGEAQSIGERVYPGVPAALKIGLQPFQPVSPGAQRDSSGNRLALARWLTQANHPLTSRVIVNRIWMNHFGRGLVPSPANFGRSGQPPSHPELLDWLATEFVRQGWSIKTLHRLMMTSAAYRQSSRVRPDLLKADPENTLLSRMALRRLDAEGLYDSILSVTDRLDPQQFGKPAEIEEKPSGEIIAKGGKNGWRRAIYVLKRRKTPLTLLEVFDQPRMSPNCTERRQSNVSPQALQMMNGDTARQHARYLAGRLIDEFPGDREKQIRQLYLRTISRLPVPKETQQALTSMNELAKHWRSNLEEQKNQAPRVSTAEWYALSSLAHAMLSSGEFLYID
ncbi:MAG: DUF1553 domain-containing protein [Acidobacteria bacterium]|nr:DUF1553 domain-containing protein [Acidobacteriota bacterium]